VFSNLNWYNVVVLLLLALFIFGDKLPQMISEGLKMLRNLRRMAQNATSDLSRELGTDIRLEDLHPKTFVRKHLLSEDDQQALTRPFKDLSDDVTRQTRGLRDGFDDVGKQAQGVADEVRRATDRGRSGSSAVRGDGATRSVGASGDGAPPVDPTGPVIPPRPGFDDIT
jgi:sec-independent protein translocase protein TatB